MVLVLAACTDGSGLEDQASADLGEAEDDAEQGDSAAANDDGGDDPSPEQLAAVASGTLRLGTLGELPARPRDASPVDAAQLMVADLLADGLTALDPDGKPIPALAESWEHNEAATSWSFTLRPDAQFSDGTLISAADVKLSLEAVANDPDLLAGETLAKVVGFDEGDSLSGLVAVDDVTLRIDLTEPVRYLDSSMALPALGVTGANRAETSGPWKILSRSDDQLVLTAERSSDDGAGPNDPAGTIDTIEIYRFEDVADARAAFEAAEVDLVWLGLGVVDPTATYFDGHVTAMLGSRLSSPVVDDVAVRNSLELAIDRESLVSDVFGQAAQPLWGLVPSGLGQDVITCVRDCFDRSQAREGLAPLRGEALPSRPAVVTLDHPQGTWQGKLAEGLAGDLEAAGLVVETRAHTNEELAEVLATDDVELFLIGSVAQSASPEAYLLSLFGDGASQNLTGYQNQVVDNLRRPNGPTVARAEQQVLSDDPAIPLAQFDHSVFVGPRVDSVELRLDGTLVLDRLRLG